MAATLSRCGTYRYTLSRDWSSLGGRVCFIGLNPSTADHRIDDPTVKRWIHFAKAWGYGGFTAVNLYPYRSSSPAECKQWSEWEKNGPDWYARDAILLHNQPILIEEAKKADLVVACWGAGLWDWFWAENVIEEVRLGVEPWPDLYCFGLTKHGCPIHPMARGKHRVPDDAKPILWKEGFKE